MEDCSELDITSSTESSHSATLSHPQHIPTFHQGQSDVKIVIYPRMACASSPTPEAKSIVAESPRLVTAISCDPLAISHALSSKGLISTETLSKMLITSYTPAEKATIVVEAVRKCVEIAPTRFEQLLQILSEQTMTKAVVDGLRSTYQSECHCYVMKGANEVWPLVTYMILFTTLLWDWKHGMIDPEIDDAT